MSTKSGHSDSDEGGGTPRNRAGLVARAVMQLTGGGHTLEQICKTANTAFDTEFEKQYVCGVLRYLKEGGVVKTPYNHATGCGANRRSTGLWWDYCGVESESRDHGSSSRPHATTVRRGRTSSPRAPGLMTFLCTITSFDVDVKEVVNRDLAWFSAWNAALNDSLTRYDPTTPRIELPQSICLFCLLKRNPLLEYFSAVFARKRYNEGDQDNELHRVFVDLVARIRDDIAAVMALTRAHCVNCSIKMALRGLDDVLDVFENWSSSGLLLSTGLRRWRMMV